MLAKTNAYMLTAWIDDATLSAFISAHATREVTSQQI